MKKVLLVLTIALTSIKGYAQYNELQQLATFKALPVIAEDFQPNQVVLGISSNGSFNYFKGVLETPSGLFGELGYLEGDLGFLPTQPGDTRALAMFGYKFGNDKFQMDVSAGSEVNIGSKPRFSDASFAARIGGSLVLFNTQNMRALNNPPSFSMSLDAHLLAFSKTSLIPFIGLSTKVILF